MVGLRPKEAVSLHARGLAEWHHSSTVVYSSLCSNDNDARSSASRLSVTASDQRIASLPLPPPTNAKDCNVLRAGVGTGLPFGE